MFSNISKYDSSIEELTNMFVPLIENKKIVDYNTYMKNPEIMKTYKVPELKQISKYYKLLTSGVKSIIRTNRELFLQMFLL